MKKLNLKNKFKLLIKKVIVSPFRCFGSLFLNKKTTIVMGCSSNHFSSMLQLINSIKLIDQSNTRIVAYDLGLNEDEKLFFNEKNPDVILKKFDYSKYPSFFNIEIKAGAYAWKPAMIYDEYSSLRKNDYLIYLDAGCFVTKPMSLIRAVICMNGLYCNFTGGIIRNMTHSKTLETIGEEGINDLKMIQAGVIGLKVGTAANDNLIHSWYANACQESIISPENSSQSNHRYDQSLFSLQVYKSYKSKRR